MRRFLTFLRTGGAWRRHGEFAALTLIGTLVGVILFAHGNVGIGPLRAGLSLQPTFSGGTVVELGPLGQIRFASHSGLVRVHLNVHSMTPSSATDLVTEPAGLDELTKSASTDLRAGFRKVAGFAVTGATFCSFILVLLASRRLRAAAIAAACSLLISLLAAASAYLTYQPQAIRQPEYRGLVSAAPSLIGSARDIAENFDQYRDQMGRLLTNVSRLYTTGSGLPDYGLSKESVTVLHISDLHLNPQGWDMVRQLVKDFNVDVVVDSGDVSDHGTAIEDRFLEPIRTIGVPYVYVRGNHDSEHTAEQIASYPNATVLDSDSVEIAGLLIAGIADKRFTPDKATKGTDDLLLEAASAYAAQLARSHAPGANAVKTPSIGQTRPSIVVVHDPAVAGIFDGLTDVILAGHLHHRSTKLLAAGTRLMVEGSTGGSGLRSMQDGTADALQATLLHFTKSGTLQSWDEVTMSGLGLASVEITRRLP